MRIDAFEYQVRIFLETIQSDRNFVRHNPLPVHPRVHLEMDALGTLERHRQLTQHMQVGDREGDVPESFSADQILASVADDQNRGFHARSTQYQSFIKRINGKKRRADAVEHGSDFPQTVSISVALQHRSDGETWKLPGECFVVA